MLPTLHVLYATQLTATDMVPSITEESLAASALQNMAVDKVRALAISSLAKSVGGDQLLAEYIFLQLFSKMYTIT
jgi:Mini-chromosome maintenance replisome factor